MKKTSAVDNMQNIDITSASFENLIKNKLVYVDKTDYLYSLVRKGVGYYFLSRPRRFGKSLTVSTLKAIFQGKKELFRDLYIGSTDYDFNDYPVIHIDFSALVVENAEDFEESLLSKLNNVAKNYNITLKEISKVKSVFENLIVALNEQYGKVVVLVDEYDKPLSDNVNNQEEALKIRDVLRGFFEVIKASYDYIRFVFITGVTKYSKVSIFSSMNNLFDLSLTDAYSTMLGYTEEELLHYFAEGIDEGASNLGLPRDEYIDMIRTWYDGYLFSPGGQRVYNPVSIGYFFEEKGKYFRNYWSRTGGPKLLYDVATNINFNVETDIEKSFDLDSLQSYDIVELATTDVSKYNYNSLLFQAGYLTIKGARGNIVSLGFPNKEIEKSYLDMLMPLYVGEGKVIKSSTVMLDYLETGDIDTFMSSMKAIFSSIPNNIIGKYEYSFQTGFYCILKAMGAKIEAEVPTNKGRIDATLETDNHIYIFEFKVDQSATVAIEQIKQKGYAERFNTPENKGKVIHLMGISFSEEHRNLDEIIQEEYTIT